MSANIRVKRFIRSSCAIEAEFSPCQIIGENRSHLQISYMTRDHRGKPVRKEESIRKSDIISMHKC